MFLVLCLLLPFFGSIFYFSIYAGSEWAKVIYTLVKIFTLVVSVYYLVCKGGVKKTFTRQNIGRDLLVGCGFGLLSAVVILLTAFLFWEKVLAAKGSITDKVTDMGVGEYFILFGLALSFLHSLIEELYWRGFCFGELKERIKPTYAVVVGAVAFSLHHYVVASAYFESQIAVIATIGVFMAGIAWNLCYLRYDNLVAAWVSHILADLAIMGIGWYVLFR